MGEWEKLEILCPHCENWVDFRLNMGTGETITKKEGGRLVNDWRMTANKRLLQTIIENIRKAEDDLERMWLDAESGYIDRKGTVNLGKRLGKIKQMVESTLKQNDVDRRRSR
jgi:hypothetical protein